MLSLQYRDRRWGRREFLRAGSLGLGGLGLNHLLNLQNAFGLESESLVRDRSIIFLFLHGGPSQTETFDPKMNAPSGIRSATGALSTALPGIQFGGTFPRLASLADKFSIVRSFQSGNGNHDIKPVVAPATSNANLGSLYGRIAGTNHPETGMPRNAALFPRCVDSEAQPANLSFGNFSSTGSLGSAYAPFVPGGGGEAQQAMKLQFEPTRLDDRRSLLSGLDRIQRDIDTQGTLQGLDRFQQQAFSTILGGVAKAFDLSREDRQTLKRFDTAPLVRPEEISKKWNNYNNYVDNAKTLGKLLLLARRMCESGCGFVTVTTNFVWDMHSDVNNATVEEGMQYMGWPLDYAVSALIEDLESRGLDDRIMLVVTGEMGRTPKINAKGGRDHWGGLTPLMVYGGGLKGGQVIGQSTSDAGAPASTPIRLEHLVATVMHNLLDMGKLRTMTGIPNDLLRSMTAAEPVEELVG